VNIPQPLRNCENISYASGAKEWHRPEPLPNDCSALRLRVRILNYIAHLTDYTCRPSDFQSPSTSKAFTLGAASRFVHASRVAHQSAAWFSSMPLHPTKFEKGIHSWRIAILGIADTRQICMVPASAKKGDLVVAITPGLVAMLIRPTTCTSAAAGLYNEYDSNKTPSHPVMNESSWGHPFRLFPDWDDILTALGLWTTVANLCICYRVSVTTKSPPLYF
jgi:hypothetical protein